MKTLTGTERIFKALQLQEPDRVPHFELGVNPEVRQKILPDSSYRDLVEHFDWDAALLDDRVIPSFLTTASGPSV